MSMKPFLRWAGSKRQLIPILSQYWKPSFNRYIEPIAGSACLFFHLNPSKAILADVNNELIETYNQIKDNFMVVFEILNKMKKNKTEYLYLRTINTNNLSPQCRAARFIYLNRYCFNGLYRTNRRGLFNVPYGGQKTGTLPTKEQFALCSLQLKNVRLICASFNETLKEAQKGDFVYMDPPYTVKGKRIFNEYNSTLFTNDSLQNLRKWLIKLDRKGISFLVSYEDSEEARFLGTNFNNKQVQVKRNIAGFTNCRKRGLELLIYN